MAERHDEIKSFCHKLLLLVLTSLDLLCKSGRYLLSNLLRILRNCVVLFLVFVFVIVSVSILFKATKSGSGSPSTSSRQVVQGKSLTWREFQILKCQKTPKLSFGSFGETKGFTAILGKSQYPFSPGQLFKREGVGSLPSQGAPGLEKIPDLTDSLNFIWYPEKSVFYVRIHNKRSYKPAWSLQGSIGLSSRSPGVRIRPDSMDFRCRKNTFDTRKTLVAVAANVHFVVNFPQSGKGQGLHTYQENAQISLKKVDLSDGGVDDFFGGNFVVFSETKLVVVVTANTQFVKIYRKGILELHTHQGNAVIYLKKVKIFFDTRKTLVAATANVHFVLSNPWYRLELELHTSQEDARISLKKVVHLSDGGVDNFLRRIVVDFSETELGVAVTAKAKSVKVYRKGTLKLHTHQENTMIYLKKVESFFDTRKTLVAATTNVHFVLMNTRYRLELLHTSQENARISLKKVVDLSDGGVDNFLRRIVVDFSETTLVVAMTANAQFVKIYQKGMLELHTRQENAVIYLKKVKIFFDTRKTLVVATANVHFVLINLRCRLELELHTSQENARISLKKIVNLSYRGVDDFLRRTVVDFFGIELVVAVTANAQFVKIYRKGVLELHTHQENAVIYLKKVKIFFDTRETLVVVAANVHFVLINPQCRLDSELRSSHGNARISLKKAVDLSDGGVDDFFEGNVADPFKTKLVVAVTANAQFVEIFRKGTSELHTHRGNAVIYPKKVKIFFDTMKILVAMAANVHLVLINPRCRLEPELHTSQKNFLDMTVNKVTGGRSDVYLYRRNRPP